MTETKIKVDMDGKTYLKYLESRKVKFPKIKWNNKSIGTVIIICSLLTLAFIPIIYESFNPPATKVWGYSHIYSLTIHNGLIMWLAACIGLAWIIHGFGFIIIRR